MTTGSINTLMDDLEENMMKALEAMQHDFAGIRTGKASPALVENIMVEYYGSATRLKELAGITIPEARMLVIQPWDPSSIAAIEKAIIASNIGISPMNDGHILRLPIPELSEERRLGLAKQVKSRAEDAKIAMRNIRRDGNEVAKKGQKNGDVTEDELKELLDKIQHLTDDYIKQIDDLVAIKDKDLLSV